MTNKIVKQIIDQILEWIVIDTTKVPEKLQKGERYIERRVFAVDFKTFAEWIADVCEDLEPEEAVKVLFEVMYRLNPTIAFENKFEVEREDA